MRMAAAIFGPKRLYLDHLAPLAAFLGIPLVVTDNEIFSCAKRFYPDIEIKLYEGLTGTTTLVANHEILITTLARILLKRTIFFACQALQKEPKMIWIPHGNSDKGRKKPLMEGLGSEEMILVYGQKMLDFIEDKGVLHQIQHVHQIGNYRLAYYQKQKEFYKRLLKRPFDNDRKTILYAPTWEDFEDSGTLFGLGLQAIEQLLPTCNLLVKLHPNTTREKEAELTQLKERFKGENILFLEEFPPIYPLCDLADAYLGDMSSIGYDFLTFKKPMFFLNQHDYDSDDLSLTLHRCGKSLTQSTIAELPHLIKEAQETTQKEKLYSHTFSQTPNAEILKSDILGAWESGKNLQKN